MNATGPIRPYRGDKPYVFVSYSHNDMDEVMNIVAHMLADGYRVWFDEGIDPGTEWDDNIATHVAECDFFLAMLSEHYIKSDNCRDELNYARDLSKPRVLIYLEDVDLPRGMQMRLGRLQAIFKNRYDNEVWFYEKLYASEGLDKSKTTPAQRKATGRSETSSTRSDSATDSDTEVASFAATLEGEASAIYKDLIIYRKHGKKSRSDCTYLVAQSAERLAELLEKQGRGLEATHFYRESLSAYRELEKRESDRYLYLVAQLAFKTGLSLAGMYDTTVKAHLATGSHEAEDHYREAFEIWKSLAKRDPAKYLPLAAQAAHNLAYLLNADGRSDESIRYYRESLAMRKKLAARQPETYLPTVAVSDMHLARVLESVGQVDEAQQLRAEAKSIKQR